ncbi:MAG: hypothetical protein JW891_15090, partial [Candidatus Lokiarchaeota archaeon]|nr:hypothetical protein [Candidatus Lokiarchaeota archaeon]
YSYFLYLFSNNILHFLLVNKTHGVVKLKLEKVIGHEFRDDIYITTVPALFADIKDIDVLKVNEALQKEISERECEVLYKSSRNNLNIASM